jgi:hypothetical protein
MKDHSNHVQKFSHEGNDRAAAAWMLSLVDSSPDKLAVFGLTFDSPEAMDEGEGVVIRAYNLAKQQRPALAVHVGPGQAVPPTRHASIIVSIHEHHFIGGACVNGCRDTPDTSPKAQAA